MTSKHMPMIFEDCDNDAANQRYYGVRIGEDAVMGSTYYYDYAPEYEVAKEMVRVWNCHDELLGALEEAVELVDLFHAAHVSAGQIEAALKCELLVKPWKAAIDRAKGGV